MEIRQDIIQVANIGKSKKSYIGSLVKNTLRIVTIINFEWTNFTIQPSLFWIFIITIVIYIRKHREVYFKYIIVFSNFSTYNWFNILLIFL